MTKVLIFTASVGEGHDLPARLLASELTPEADVEIIDALDVMGRAVRGAAVEAMRTTFGAGRMNWVFDLQYLVFARLRPTRALAQALLARVTGSKVLRAIERHSPDVIVSTYPAITPVLGSLRRRGRLRVPACSAITDLSSLAYWAAPGVDLHLVTHPESVDEVRSLASRTEVRPTRGLTDPRFLSPPQDARGQLGLPEDVPVVAVSGGGWGVGDLAGAVDVARDVGATVLCLCGRNERIRAELARRYANDECVRVLGFVDDMPTIFGAADVLVHSTAGLTVLEAYMLGCRPISYGWGVGHIRLNNKAFVRDGIAQVATSPKPLRAALVRALAAPRVPRYEEFARLPSAASLVLELARRGRKEDDTANDGAQGEHKRAPAQRHVVPRLSRHSRREQHR